VRRGGALVAVVACVLGALLAPAARGDGDPASDVLVKDRVFWPYYVKIPPESRERLNETVAQVTKNGFPVRVALIQNDYDLGSAGVLYKHPQDYAKFLAEELANFNRDWLIVVMPNGYGIYRCIPIQRPEGYIDPCEKATPTAADQKLLRSLAPIEQSKLDIAAAAEVAVREVAARRGVSADGRSRVLTVGLGALVVLGAGALVFLLLRRRRYRVAS